MIEVKNVDKWYGPFRALHEISFEVPKREIVGFLGPNGAGKTTMMKILTTFLHPDEGKAKVCDMDVSRHPLKVRNQIGYLPEHTPLYDDMRVRDFLRFIGQARGVKRKDIPSRIMEMVETCGLEDVLAKPIYTLSKGYRQRVGLAQAMIHNPEVLILDEPTTGLDPNQIQDVRDLIRRIGQERTVMLSTHILSEVQAVCNRVLIIHQGELVADDTLANLTREKTRRYRLRFQGDREKLEETLEGMENIASVDFEEEGEWFEVKVEAEEEMDIGDQLFKAVAETEGTLSELRPEVRSLEDIFREKTQDVSVKKSGAQSA